MFSNCSEYEINDGNIYHESLYKNGDITIPQSWHYNNMKPLCDIIKQNLHENITFIDYGTGTGGSAIEIIKILKENNIKNYKLYLIDVLESWFVKAHELLKNNPNIIFLLSSKVIDNKRVFYKLSDLIPEKVNIIICANTIHLLKEKNVTALCTDIKSVLKSNGLFLINSGDINKNENINLNGFSRQLFTTIVDDNNYDSNIKNKCNKIFPKNIDITNLFDILKLNFDINITNSNIKMSVDELKLFYKTPRLNDFCFNNQNNLDILNKTIEKIYNNDTIFLWHFITCRIN